MGETEEVCGVTWRLTLLAIRELIFIWEFESHS